MNTSTTTINAALDQISSAMAAGNRQGTFISSHFSGDLFSCVCMQENINRVIDLSKDGAQEKLKALLNTLHSVVRIEGAA